MNNLCICGSNKTSSQCCKRFLSGEQHAKTPEQLMRSRYSAYALGGYGEYLLHTWFSATTKSLTVEALSERSCEWAKLEVLRKSQRGDEGIVEFKAYYRNDKSHDENGEMAVLHEKSVFIRVGGRWFYVGGEANPSSISHLGSTKQ